MVIYSIQPVPLSSFTKPYKVVGIVEMKIGEQILPVAHFILMAHLLAGSASSECPVIEEQVKRTVAAKSGDTILVFYPSPDFSSGRVIFPGGGLKMPCTNNRRN